VPDVRHTLVVSAAGLLMAMSTTLDRTRGDQLGAIVAVCRASRTVQLRHLAVGGVRQATGEMDNLFMLMLGISDGSVLAVVAGAACAADPFVVAVNCFDGVPRHDLASVRTANLDDARRSPSPSRCRWSTPTPAPALLRSTPSSRWSSKRCRLSARSDTGDRRQGARWAVRRPEV